MTQPAGPHLFSRLFFALSLLAMTSCQDPAVASSTTPPPPADAASGQPTLVLGAGCFWCVEAAYELVPGVVSAVSGYAGGARPNPTYEQVCTGATGHAEVVTLTYDPAIIDLRRLVDFFWEIHDPTTLNRQGADIGTQYRSVIYYADEREKSVIQASLAQANLAWGGKIVTEVSPRPAVYPAEDYHQDYFRRNPGAGYCQAVIRPKIEKLKKSPLVVGPPRSDS